MQFKLYLSTSTSLIGTAAALALGLASAPTARAQEAPAPQTADPTEVGEVVVTGSRIRLLDQTQSNPVVSVTAETLTYSGITNVTDFLTSFPALSNSIDNEDSANTSGQASAGLNLLDLRNLGTQRTLVLVDGRRHVAGSPGTAAIDTNTIPIGLIERVEIFTGGASAIYGADGVSGVVNFVLKDRFTGVDLRAQSGWTEAGGGESVFVSGLFGKDLLDGRLNATMALEYADNERITIFDRDYTTPGQRQVLSENPDDLADDPSLPDFVLSRNVRYPDTSRGGSVYTDLDFGDEHFGFDYQGGGLPWVSGRVTNGFEVIGGSGSLLDDFQDDLLPAQERITFNTTLRYELAPDHTLFFEGKASQVDTGFQAQPTYDFGYGDDGEYEFFGLWTGVDNPFMPASIRNDALTNPLGLGNPANAAAVGVNPGVFFQRDNFDFGYTGSDIRRRTYRAVVGLEGELPGNLDYEVSYVFGRTEEQSTYYNNRINDRFLAAIDVVNNGAGQAVCRSDLNPSAYLANPNVDQRVGARTFTPGPGSGCVPLNIFGDGSPSAAALDWILTDSDSSATIEQNVLSGYISGNTEAVFSLPGGPVGFAVGVEYRDESSVSRVSNIVRLAQSVTDTLGPGESLPYDVSWAGSGKDSAGDFDVAEAYVEFSLPCCAIFPSHRSSPSTPRTGSRTIPPRAARTPTRSGSSGARPTGSCCEAPRPSRSGRPISASSSCPRSRPTSCCSIPATSTTLTSAPPIGRRTAQRL